MINEPSCEKTCLPGFRPGQGHSSKKNMGEFEGSLFLGQPPIRFNSIIDPAPIKSFFVILMTENDTQTHDYIF